jgi:hypothetical protein
VDVTHALTQSSYYTKQNDVNWMEQFLNKFYDLGFEFIPEDTQEH